MQQKTRVFAVMVFVVWSGWNTESDGSKQGEIIIKKDQHVVMGDIIIGRFLFVCLFF